MESLHEIHYLLPSPLHRLLSRSFEGISFSDRFVSLELFQWAVLSYRRLCLHEWHHVLAFIKRPWPSLNSWESSKVFTSDDIQLEKQIRALPKGLLEATGGALEIWAAVDGAE